MRFSALYLVLAFRLCGIASGGGLEPPVTTEKETAEAREKLQAYERSAVSLDDLTANSSPTLCQNLVAYYFSHTNDFTVRAKLPVSRCCGILQRYSEAAKLAEEYVKVYTNDYRGWRVLGVANLMMDSYDRAIVALTNAARLGDDANYVGLGAAALKIDRMDVLRDIVVPHLLEQKNSETFSMSERLDMRLILAGYSLKADRRDIFVKAVGELDAKDILSRPDLRNLVDLGCGHFKGKEIRKIHQRLEDAVRESSKTKG